VSAYMWLRAYEENDSWMRSEFLRQSPPVSSPEFQSMYLNRWESQQSSGCGPHVLTAVNGDKAMCGGPGVCEWCILG
jgi:hypothetical protein